MLKNRVIIIGNGFDLDLGLKTSYKDFFESIFNPFDAQSLAESPLAYYIKSQTSINTWFDLENILHTYSSKDNNLTLRTSTKRIISPTQALTADKRFFNQIKHYLEMYIKSQINNEINKNSYAAIALKNLIKYSNNNKFITFNYTDINNFARQICNQVIDFSYVHGSCIDSSAIIGISDSYEVRNGYEFLYKTSSPHYQSTNVRYSLQEAKEIIFYGHSLGRQDYHYFQDFFERQCRDNMTEGDLCKITFFTKDENSRLSLLAQLRTMNHGRMNYLYDCNQLRFIKTTEHNEKQLQQFIKELQDRNIEEIIDKIIDYN